MSLESLVRSTVLIGSSSVAATLVSILRVKALALMVGPTGIGLLGLLAGIASAGTTIAAVGSDTSGTRQIALARGNSGDLARVRRALAFVSVLHGLLSGAVLWWMREDIAHWALGSAEYALEVGLVGIAVTLSLVAGLQIAQLQGLGRVADIARINILASIGGTAIGLIAVWEWGLGGVVPLVIAQPALAAILSVCSLRAVERCAPVPGSTHHLIGDWWRTVRQGAPYMLSFLMLALVPLAIRALVVRELGIEAAGHFHASWTMSVIYIGFLLNAMSADYFPRLTALVSDPKAATALINDQIQLGLAIGGIALLIILGGAPILVPLLYSQAFTPAVEIVELQAFGNLMKIAGWPIAFLAMARGRSMQFFLVELAWSLILLALVWIGLPRLGLAATGYAFAVACTAFLSMQLVAARLTYGFKLDRNALLILIAFAAAGALTLAAAKHSPVLQVATGTGLAALLGLTSLRLLLSRVEGGGRTVGRARQAFAVIGWPMPARIASAA